MFFTYSGFFKKKSLVDWFLLILACKNRENDILLQQACNNFFSILLTHTKEWLTLNEPVISHNQELELSIILNKNWLTIVKLIY